MYLISVFLALLILSAFSYFILLTINNIIWGYKGIPTDKESPAYGRRKRSLKLISIPLSILVLVVIGLLRTDNYTKNHGLKEQIQTLSLKSGRLATDFQKNIGELDKLRDLDTVFKINEAITIIERIQLLFYQVNQDADDLSDFINLNKIHLQNDGLDVFLDMEGLRNETYFTHRKALREYLNAYKLMLEYSRDNFGPITQGQKPKSDKYNELYLKYRNALDVHNEAYLHHMKFVDSYSNTHPALVELITKARHDLRKNISCD